MSMILHLKEDSTLKDPINGRKFYWQAGIHSVNDELARIFLELYPDKFEEGGREGILLEPAKEHTQEANTAAKPNTCPVCGKEFKNALGLTGHKRTHNRGITTADLHPNG